MSKGLSLVSSVVASVPTVSFLALRYCVSYGSCVAYVACVALNGNPALIGRTGESFTRSSDALPTTKLH